MPACYQVRRVRHNGTEPADFSLNRPNGTEDFLFIHFKSPTLFALENCPPKRLEPGTCILLSPKTPHAFSPLDGSLVHDWMHFYPPTAEAFSKLSIPQNTFLFPQKTSFITEHLRQIEQEQLTRGLYHEGAVSATAEILFITLSRKLNAPHPTEARSGQRHSFEELRLDLYRNPHHYENTTAMAHAIRLSRSRFSVLYQKFFHVSPISDLIRARTERACYYLSSEDKSIAEIAPLCGYQNEYHFIRQFKAVQGMTPGAFRRK